jgi:hypothetical protein
MLSDTKMDEAAFQLTGCRPVFTEKKNKFTIKCGEIHPFQLEIIPSKHPSYSERQLRYGLRLLLLESIVNAMQDAEAFDRWIKANTTQKN